MKLDRYDISILNEVQQNGRISIRSLAERIGLSNSPCWVRLKRLEEKGYIKGYKADIDFGRIARLCQVTTLFRLESHHAHDFLHFEAAVEKLPQVISCDAVIGEVDYIVQFITIDIDQYQRLIEKLLDSDIGILNYFSHVRSKLIKQDTGKLLNSILEELSNEKNVS